MRGRVDESTPEEAGSEAASQEESLWTSERAPGNEPQILAPRLVVAAMVVFNLILLRSETSYVPLLNDGSIHAQMVRYATHQFQSGRLPLTGWYPYLGLGSPQFLHYQSLGAMLSGLAGIVVGPDHAFNWALYLLWSSWPVSVYLGARLFGRSRWEGAISAACASMLFSVPGVGFEPTAYLWIGYGVWSQLFAMWTLPLAWGFSWRAIALGKRIWPAVLFMSLTVCLHYITGYIAILAVPVWVLLRPSEFWIRFRRLVLLGISTFFVSSWALVPLMVYGKWASINEFLQNTPSANSYGARQVLDWLFTGNLFDSGRLPVITILAGIGFVTVLLHFRTDERARALAVIFVFSVVLFFGRPTLGPLLDLLPRSHDLFLRRFMFGVQLGGLLLAGIGGVTAGHLLQSGIASLRTRRIRFGSLWARQLGIIALLVLVLAPGWTQLASYYQLDSTDLAYQKVANVTEGTEVDALVSSMKSLGPGRVYAGLPTNWGQQFLVGDIPVFKYLSNLDLDVVGYTLRTASLMTDPEAEFAETDPSDYQIFGVRYFIIPSSMAPPVPARFIAQAGNYQLWMIPSVTGYFQVAETATTISENRATIGASSLGFVDADTAAGGLYPTVSYAGAPAAPPIMGLAQTSSGAAGAVVSQSENLVDGRASVVVSISRTSVVVFKVSFDPGWQATLDGLPVKTQMVAPALVGVMVGPGVHVLTFRYVGYRHYLLLFGVGAIAFALCVLGRRVRHRWGPTSSRWVDGAIQRLR